jgi:preprotein translocase subunit Sec63
MSKIEQHTTREYQASPTDFPDSDQHETILPSDPTDSPENFVELLKKLDRSSWLCEVAEA